MKAAMVGSLAILLSCSTLKSPVQPGPADVVEQYLNAVAAGERQIAYELLSADDRSAVALSDFVTKGGTAFKVIGERKMSAEVAIEMKGPEPAAFQKFMNELMDGRFSLEEIKQRTTEAFAVGRFPMVKIRMHYLVFFEDGGWRVAAGYGARKKILEAAEELGTFSGSMRHLIWTNPALEPRVGPAEDLLAEMQELRRQNTRLWQANHRLLDQALRAEPPEKKGAGVPPERRTLYASMIESKGPFRYQLRRELAELDFSTMATEGRLVPSFVDGQAIGFKVFAILPGSVFDTLGFESGDVLTSINGIELLTLEESRRAYESLMTAKSFDVELTRGGQSVSLSYSVVEQ